MLTWHRTAQAGEWGIPPLQLGDPNADMARYGTGWGVGESLPCSWEILMLTWHGTAQAGEWGIPPL